MAGRNACPTLPQWIVRNGVIGCIVRRLRANNRGSVPVIDLELARLGGLLFGRSPPEHRVARGFASMASAAVPADSARLAGGARYDIRWPPTIL